MWKGQRLVIYVDTGMFNAVHPAQPVIINFLAIHSVVKQLLFGSILTSGGTSTSTAIGKRHDKRKAKTEKKKKKKKRLAK